MYLTIYPKSLLESMVHAKKGQTDNFIQRTTHCICLNKKQNNSILNDFERKKNTHKDNLAGRRSIKGRLSSFGSLYDGWRGLRQFKKYTKSIKGQAPEALKMINPWWLNLKLEPKLSVSTNAYQNTI